jgi:hypothetical protein
VKGATSSISGDGGEWGEERMAAAGTSKAVHPGVGAVGPPEICGAGRATEFIAAIRSVARWAEARARSGS